jgi:hypothetical protein
MRVERIGYATLYLGDCQAIRGGICTREIVSMTRSQSAKACERD